MGKVHWVCSEICVWHPSWELKITCQCELWQGTSHPGAALEGCPGQNPPVGQDTDGSKWSSRRQVYAESKVGNPAGVGRLVESDVRLAGTPVLHLHSHHPLLCPSYNHSHIIDQIQLRIAFILIRFSSDSLHMPHLRSSLMYHSLLITCSFLLAHLSGILHNPAAARSTALLHPAGT